MREYGHLTSNPGLITNLRFYKSGSTINFVQSNASPLGVGDASALVRYRDGLTHELVEITAPISFTDGAGGSFDGNTLGTTAGVAWAASMPLFLYIAVRSGVAALMLSRNPCLTVTPSTVGKIAQKGNSNADTADSVLFLTTGLTTSEWVSQYVQPLGGMTATKNAADQWTFTIDNWSGLGQQTIDLLMNQAWTMPAGHSGSEAGKWGFVSAGGTFPAYPEISEYSYYLKKSGFVRISAQFYGSTGVAGSGAGVLRFGMPFPCITSSNISFRGAGAMYNTTGGWQSVNNGTVGTFDFVTATRTATPNVELTGNDQNGASRNLIFSFEYKAF